MDRWVRSHRFISQARIKEHQIKLPFTTYTAGLPASGSIGSGRRPGFCSLALLAGLLLSGCAGSALSPPALTADLPEQWQSKIDTEEVASGWLVRQGDARLLELVNEALLNNHALARQRAELEAARQQVTIAGAPLYPAFDLSLTGARIRTLNDGVSRHSSDIGANLEAGWELDIWGKLGAAKRRALLTFNATEQSLAQARLRLAAQVAGAWYEVLQAHELTLLFEERLDNLGNNLEIIEFGYRQGITAALDVYLARNEVEQERARLQQQRQAEHEAVSRLQFLLGRYPSGEMGIDAKLPVLTGPVPAGVPSALLKRRPSIQSAWLELLAADAGLAVAHKERFPALRLTGTVGDSGSALNQLFDGGPLGWSLLGGLTQPLFAGGRLAAREEQARAELQQAEQRYLDHLFSALTEVENRLNEQYTLDQRYQSFLKAQDNALAAQRLAFDQYQRGLVSYTSVLESQRRAFDAQSTVLQLRNQLLQSRIALQLALGGSALNE